MARTKIPAQEKITLVKIWVKRKNVKKATAEAKVIQEKYNK